MHRDSIDRYQVQTIPNLLGQKRLGSYLIEAGLITEAQINVALNDQQATGMRFGEILATRGWVKQQTIEYLMNKVVIPERKALERQQKPPEQRPSSQAARTQKSQTQPAAQAATAQKSQGRSAAQATIPQGQRTVQQPREVPPKRSTMAARTPTGVSDRRRTAVPGSTPGTGANAANDPSFQRREAPITKPLPPVSNPDDDVSWVG